MEVCPPLSDITPGLRGPASELEAFETPVQLSGAQFLCRAAESEATWPRDPRSWVFWPPSALLPSHTRQGGCPQWSWGSDPRVELHGFASSPGLLASTSQRGRREGVAGKGPISQHSTFPVSALGDYAPKHQTSNQRETSSDNANPCFLCL